MLLPNKCPSSPKYATERLCSTRLRTKSCSPRPATSDVTGRVAYDVTRLRAYPMRYGYPDTRNTAEGVDVDANSYRLPLLRAQSTDHIDRQPGTNRGDWSAAFLYSQQVAVSVTTSTCRLFFSFSSRKPKFIIFNSTRLLYTSTSRSSVESFFFTTIFI